LAVPRLLWALANRTRRPPAAPPPLGHAARAGHLLLYGMMVVIPAIALLRAYGDGKGLALGTVQLIPASGRRIPALTAPADLLHAALGWGLAALVFGHLAMALLHHFVTRDDTLRRMLGRVTGER
ncbi:MAG: cytochrome b/b6 domain-containing protein, partial [Sphingomonas sp.]